jgi:hypothetical protein
MGFRFLLLEDVIEVRGLIDLFIHVSVILEGSSCIIFFTEFECAPLILEVLFGTHPLEAFVIDSRVVHH